MSYLLAFSISIVCVFFKALQNRNFNFENYWAIMPTSWAVAACELYLLALVIKELNIAYVLAVGTGSGIGGIVGVACHRRWVSKHKK